MTPIHKNAFFVRSVLSYGTAALFLCAAVAACGGGNSNGDETAASTAPGESADLYVGTWERCIPDTPSGSARYTMVNTKTGALTVTSDLTYLAFASSDCSGSVRDTSVGKSNLTILGEGAADGRSVFKVSIFHLMDAAQPNPTLNIHALEGNQLFEGLSGTRDSSGYPTRLDLARPWTRR